MAHSKKTRRGTTRANSPSKTRTSTTRAASSAHAHTSPTTTRQATVEAKPMPHVVTTQAIAQAAYFLWLERGGNEIVNWLEAEAMLKKQHAAV